MIFLTPYNTFRWVTATEGDKQVLSPSNPYRNIEGLYVQKVAVADNALTHIHAVAGSNVQLRYITCTEETIYAETLPLDQKYPSYTKDGIDYQCFTRIGLPAFMLDKTFYIELIVSNNDGTVVFLTEPINYAAQHENTKLFICRNRDNKNFANFEQSNLAFSIRVESALVQNIPSVDKVLYKDIDQNPVLLSATPYDTWKIQIGTNSKGVPDWVLEKINYFMHTDLFTFEKVAYVATEDSNLNIQAETKYKLRFAEVLLRRASQLEGYTNAYRDVSLLSGITYPFLFVDYKYKENNVSKYLFSESVIVNNVTELETLVGDINTTSEIQLYITSGDIRAYGTFGLNGSVEFNILSKITTLQTITPTANMQGVLKLAGIGGKVGIVDASGAILKLAELGLNGATNVTNNSESYEYVFNSLILPAPNIRLFHKDNITLINMQEITLVNNLVNLPKVLESLTVFKSPNISSLNFASLLTPCVASIKTVLFRECTALNNVTNYTNSNLPAYANLISIRFIYNAILTTPMNTFITEMGNAAYSGKLVVSGGQVSFLGNAGAYTASSLWHRNVLINNFGWQVN